MSPLVRRARSARPATGRARLAASLALAVSFLAPPAFAGGFLKAVDVTGQQPSPIPGQLVADLVPVRWDARCIPVGVRLNDTLDPVPNPLGPPVLSLAGASPVLAQALASWTQIKTSYLAFALDGTTDNSGLAGFDFVNELTFRAPADLDFIALTTSTVLIEDSLLAAGDDIDQDGDSDVSAAIATCTDVDSDGDFELPAGSYEAGTLLDADVTFNSVDFRFTAGDAAVDTNPASVDLLAVAVHEIGHAGGLSHALDNQLASGSGTSSVDGTSTTMFPFIDTGDPADETAIRSLGDDDLATVSLHYQEGTASAGPAALQPGDVRFRQVYGRLTGRVTDGETGIPLAGASVAAENVLTGRLAAAAFSGHTRVSYDPDTEELFVIDEAFNILDGDYELPLPLGLYRLRIEAVDGLPVSSASITPNEEIGDFFGQHDFHEEGYSFPFEGAVEVSPGFATPVLAVPGLALGGHDLTTNVQLDLAHFNALTGFAFTAAPAGTYYAVRIPTADLLAADDGDGLDVQAAEFLTAVADSSEVPAFAEALLATGSISGSTASIDLENPLRQSSGFIGQDLDFAPFYFALPRQLGRELLREIDRGDLEELFLVLRVPTSTPFPGVSGLPPLVGFSTVGPIAGNSYTSTDGGVVFNRRTDLDFHFRLVLTPR